jgi:hypothetical protein
MGVHLEFKPNIEKAAVSIWKIDVWDFSWKYHLSISKVYKLIKVFSMLI